MKEHLGGPAPAGTPCVFLDHLDVPPLSHAIRRLIALRRRVGLHCRSQARSSPHLRCSPRSSRLRARRVAGHGPRARTSKIQDFAPHADLPGNTPQVTLRPMLTCQGFVALKDLAPHADLPGFMTLRNLRPKLTSCCPRWRSLLRTTMSMRLQWTMRFSCAWAPGHMSRAPAGRLWKTDGSGRCGSARDRRLSYVRD